MFNYLQNLEPNEFKPTSLGDQPTLSDFGIFTVNALIAVGFSLGIISMAYSALLYALSKGDPKATQRGWQAFLWGLIASLVALVATGIKAALLTALGVDTGAIVDDAPGF